MSGDDGDEAWIANLLNQHAGKHEIDVDALLARLSAETGQPFGGNPAGVPFDEPLDRPVVRRGPLRGVPALHAKPVPAGDRRRRLAPIALAAAAMVAVSLSAPAVADLSRWRPGPGASVEVGRPSSGPPTGGALAPDAPSPGPSRPVDGRAPTADPKPRTSIGDSTVTSAPPEPTSGTDTGARFRLPTTPRWRLGDPLAGPSRTAAKGGLALDDPTITFHDGRWHVFATAVGPTGTSLVYLSFGDWSQAPNAEVQALDGSGIGTGRRSAPQVFWFAPQRLWYLVHRNGGIPSYSTNPDIGKPSGWTASRAFGPGTSSQTGSGGGDWVICDRRLCHLYSTDGAGRLYRAQTRLADFPRRMSTPVVALQDGAPGRLLGSPSVYQIVGIDRFLLLAGAVDGAGRRYVRSWTSSDAAGRWSEFAGSEANPFVGAATTSSERSASAPDVGPGELLRAGNDQTATLDTCHLQYLFGGAAADPAGTNQPPVRLGLLRNENPRC